MRQIWLLWACSGLHVASQAPLASDTVAIVPSSHEPTALNHVVAGFKVPSQWCDHTAPMCYLRVVMPPGFSAQNETCGDAWEATTGMGHQADPMRFPFLTGTELMLGNMSSCNASRDNVSGLDELNFAWDPWEALWGVSWPNALNALDTVAFQFSVVNPALTPEMNVWHFEMLNASGHVQYVVENISGFPVANASLENISQAEAAVIGPAYNNMSFLVVAAKLTLPSSCGGAWVGSPLWGPLQCHLSIHMPNGICVVKDAFDAMPNSFFSLCADPMLFYVPPEDENETETETQPAILNGNESCLPHATRARPSKAVSFVRHQGACMTPTGVPHFHYFNRTNRSHCEMMCAQRHECYGFSVSHEHPECFLWMEGHLNNSGSSSMDCNIRDQEMCSIHIMPEMPLVANRSYAFQMLIEDPEEELPAGHWQFEGHEGHYPKMFQSDIYDMGITPTTTSTTTTIFSMVQILPSVLLPMQVGPVCIAFRLPSPMEGGQMHVIFPSMFSLPDPGGYGRHHWLFHGSVNPLVFPNISAMAMPLPGAEAHPEMHLLRIVFEPLATLMPMVTYAFQFDIVNPLTKNATHNMWQLRTFSEDGQPLQRQNIQGYELDMNETDINASLVPVFVPDAFRSAAVIPHSADALMQTAVCTAFSLPTGACSSPHGCELLLHTPVGFIPEDEFCGSTFQRGAGEAKLADVSHFPFLTGTELGLHPLTSCNSSVQSNGGSIYHLIIPPGSLVDVSIYAFQFTVVNPASPPTENSWILELWSRSISSDGYLDLHLTHREQLTGYTVLTEAAKLSTFQYARADHAFQEQHRPKEYSVAVEFKPRANCGGFTWLGSAVFGVSMCITQIELPLGRCAPNWVYDCPSAGKGFDRCVNTTLFPSLGGLRCLPTDTVMTPKKDAGGCWLEFRSSVLYDTFDYVFQLQIIAVEPISTSANLWGMRTFESGLDLINSQQTIVGFVADTTTTTTTTWNFAYASIYEHVESVLEPATLCVTFDVEESFLPDPALHIYLPSGFQSMSPTCHHEIHEVNLTLFPQCLGQPFVAMASQQASCEEIYDPRHLRYYLKLSVQGVSNATLGHAFQFQVKVPRVRPESNSWSVDLRYNDRVYAAGINGFLISEWPNKCKCLYQTSLLPAQLIAEYPDESPGKYAHLSSIDIYGTTCGVWDMMPQTPWYSHCSNGSDFSSSYYATASHNWCQLPWCYVDAGCPTASATRLFNGSLLHYSYDTCGRTPDCYNNFESESRCPYDPHGTGNYLIFKSNGCECLYHGSELPESLYANLPPVPGQYENVSYIRVTGTTCAAWDQVPGTPWAQYCPPTADWCHSNYNFCQLPWCFVGDSCESKLMAHGFSGSQAAYYSYDTCLSAPDCKTMPFDDACPFDSADTGWATAQECPESWSDVCDCLYQGNFLPPELYTQFPEDEPGKYSMFPNIAIYGTACAAWDQVPGTPWSHQCAPGSNWSSPNFNWCQLPWCFVDKRCASRIPSVVFNGSMAYYSYDTCGNTPDCYNDFSSDKRCPYDPYGTKSYKVHKGHNCECILHGSHLPADVYTLYPLGEPGKYANLTHISVYGTTCAAWDQMPSTPWAPYCPRDADWCRSEFNFCQLPFCYVSAECPRKIPTRIWHGVASGPAVNSSMAWMASHFSYDTCLSTPDCYSRPFDAACPFDWVHSGWSTQQRCPYSWSDVCQCTYQGRLLPPDLYMNFPLDFPGKYQHLPNIAAYGTSCAAWDQVPGTPLHSSCKPGSNWTSQEHNWCQVPWCYVHPSCPSSIATHLFEGSMTAFYSYDACGNAPDCYANSSVDSQTYCPYDPSGDKSYKIHKSRGCECIYQGRQLPSYFYMDFPLSDRGRYANLSLISIYGTTCAAWDQFPETPGFQYCPPDTDWCHSTNNWCQLPWCYVSASCSSKIETSIFSGYFEPLYYSYDTCLATPDCYTDPFDAACPFDSRDTAWSTASQCNDFENQIRYDGWTDVCQCIFQGGTLPEDVYTHFPLEAPGRHATLTNIKLYGSSCAAWDQFPGTPHLQNCPPGSNWSHPDHNWCQLPWCYVSSSCVYKIPSRAFNGSNLYYSYEICGAVPDCYNDFAIDKRCPYDPYGTQSYVVHKGNGCECSYHGVELPESAYRNYPVDAPGKYENASYIKIYGTSCAAWDQMPGTPWIEYCPSTADWCNSMYNWCQLPWCFVGSSCSTRVATTVFAGSEAAFLSYDTCLSAPDRSTTPYDIRCPFDSNTLSWSTGAFCVDSWSDVCQCLYQGRELPGDIIAQYPLQQPGQFASLPNVALYGTACATWDSLPGTPFAHRCQPGSDWSGGDKNWCQLPWCYVSKGCVTSHASSVFNGSELAYYSYDACGNAPNCYDDFATDSRCPFDPHQSGGYTLHKGQGCECIHAGRELPTDLLLNYPLNDPGKYANLTYARIYGTSCAAWDAMPKTPWSQYCLPGSDWCSTDYNWCTVPWCYVSDSCATRIMDTTFHGPGAQFYSYDTCLSSPRCRRDPFDPQCPFDSKDNGWSTAEDCPDSWSDVCTCIYQGLTLPEDLYTNFPTTEPGRYSTLRNIAIYGTACAPWDVVPETPFAPFCPPGMDWSSKSFNWCSISWCYVDASCVTRLPSRAFTGSQAYFSYDACGNAPDCYTDFDNNPKCPYDPYGSSTYAVHKGGKCACSYQGFELPFEVYNNFPLSSPGAYASLAHISVYGTTCAPWDQLPGTPWASYCPPGLDWCQSENNWCILPWCFVGANCSSRLTSTTFEGSFARFYSYDTCKSAPDCYHDPFDVRCPFDSNDASWSTPTVCEEGFSDVCQCLYQGQLLPPEIYAAAENFPNFSAMALYGTSCAAWDQIAGSPTASRCPPGSDFSSPDHNWCQLPWCFVSSQCPSKIPSNVFNGTNLFYSYDVCGNAPNCYHDFSGDPRCPFDPTKSFSFTLHKTEGCECKYHGYELDSNIYMSYPTSFPGKYATLPGIKIYGTSCAAWDQMPATPWSSYCPYGADWCHSNYNFCQLPWCYVGAECSSKIPSMVFEGAADMYYSHDTCFSTPNCREDHLDRNCPYDNRVSGWATSADCKHGWSDVCDCLYQGSNLPELLYENLMDNLSSIALYGTSCAAWDHIPGTPLAHHCLPGSDWSGDKNWCQVPWCYVNSSCPSRMQSRLFGNAFYSYDTCGNAPNCYDDWTHRSCPFDPYGSKSYTLHQHGGCECIFHGRHLPEEVFSNFAQAEPGRFQNLSHVRLYGTTCAAWDQMPQSPWASDCPFGADWCSSAYNWCQLPWCYVSEACASKLPSRIFGESNSTLYYSYTTCMNTPDCYTFPYDPRCPFDKMDLNWSTAAECTDGWTGIAGVPITSFDLVVEVSDIWSFEAPAVLDSVVGIGAAPADHVFIDRVLYRVAISYALLWASVQVTPDQMAQAAASAAGVSPSLAGASSSRRLDSLEAEEAESRRLQNVFQLFVASTNAADLASLQTKISSTSNLETALSSLGISAVTQATSLAAQQVVVAMKMLAADPLAMPLPVPDSTRLAAQLGQQLGMDVVVTIENEALYTPPTSTTMTMTSTTTRTGTTTSVTQTTSSTTTISTTTTSITTTTLVIETRMIIEGVEYITTEIEAWAVGYKYCLPETHTMTSTTMTTTGQYVGAAEIGGEVVFQVCRDIFVEDPPTSMECYWKGPLSLDWVKFGGTGTCAAALCRCPAWKAGNPQHQIRLTLAGKDYYTTESLAIAGGPKECITDTTTTTTTTTSTELVLDSVGVYEMNGAVHFHVCTDLVGPVICNWRRRGEGYWFPFEGYGSCYERKCSCPPITTDMFYDMRVPSTTEPTTAAPNTTESTTTAPPSTTIENTTETSSTTVVKTADGQHAQKACVQMLLSLLLVWWTG